VSIGFGRYPGLLMCPFNASAPHSPCCRRASFANKQNSTAEDRGLDNQCVCVGVWGRGGASFLVVFLFLIKLCLN
jgi:hypothetical protein